VVDDSSVDSRILTSRRGGGELRYSYGRSIDRAVNMAQEGQSSATTVARVHTPPPMHPGIDSRSVSWRRCNPSGVAGAMISGPCRRRRHVTKRDHETGGRADVANHYSCCILRMPANEAWPRPILDTLRLLGHVPDIQWDTRQRLHVEAGPVWR
jgi:hypothetical protein